MHTHDQAQFITICCETVEFELDLRFRKSGPSCGPGLARGGQAASSVAVAAAVTIYGFLSSFSSVISCTCCCCWTGGCWCWTGCCGAGGCGTLTGWMGCWAGWTCCWTWNITACRRAKPSASLLEEVADWLVEDVLKQLVVHMHDLPILVKGIIKKLWLALRMLAKYDRNMLSVVSGSRNYEKCKCN